jgi:arsenite methyltransferase
LPTNWITIQQVLVVDNIENFKTPIFNMETKIEKPLGVVMACSGASDLGELTDKLARKFRNEGRYAMKCMAMVASDDKELIESLQKSDTLIIDGCEKDCCKKIMEEAWLSNYKYIRLTDYGYVKGLSPVTNNLVEEIYSKINCSDANIITHSRPQDISCCNEENCDLFDFMSEHVGFKVLHPGGVDATKELLGHLNLDKNKKVLDIACGKGLTSIYIAKKYGCKVVGVDILEKSVEEARQMAKKHKVDHLVTFQVADAHNLSFSDNEFDVTIAQAMLILVKDKIQVMKEVKRVLKPGGISGWLELSWKKDPSQKVQEVSQKELCSACMANVETYENWEKSFRSAGVTGLRTIKHDFNFRGMSEMIKDEGFVRGLKVMYKYLTNSKIRKRMMRLSKFFNDYPEYIGYGIYTSEKNS